VEVTHAGLANVLSSLAQEPGMGSGEKLLAVTTFAFDIAGVELFLPLMVGGSVVLVPSAVAEHGKRLLGLINEVEPSVMQATPATWQMLLEAGWSPDSDHTDLRVWCGGEALPKPLADALLARSREVWNLYGPTETTIWSTCWKVEPEDPGVPIGRPLSNTEVFVLDAAGTPAPVGVPGELLIGGAGLARGYRNLPDQTEARFLSRTRAGGGEHRLYRTGDLARWTAWGALEYLGRMDFQVKVRGHRIELGEIESVLLEHGSIRAAAANVWDNRIVVYPVFDEGHQETASDIRRFLRGHLPEYMIPGFVVPLSELPMTENRKVDRKALPSPHAGKGALRSRDFEPPQGEQELAVAAIWKSLLGEDTKVGANDNFFELGGHSLLALQAVYQMEQLKGKPLDPRAIFFETLRQLAAR
jgi:acyl-coenzyme A synthetase/AMP-(fatty) acid ligase